MPNTPNVEIPYVPEGTLDPAAGLNDSLNVIDALLQPRVISMGDNAPPSTGADGDMYIVGTSPTGDWAGHANELARYVLEGQFWQFYEPGVQVQTVVNNDDGLLWIYDMVGSPNAWIEVQGMGGGGTTPMVTMPDAAYTLGDLTNGAWHEFTNVAAIVITLDDDNTDPLPDEAEYGIFCASAAGLELSPVSGDIVVWPPKGGSLFLEEGDFVVIKRRGPGSFKVLGETVASS